MTCPLFILFIIPLLSFNWYEIYVFSFISSFGGFCYSYIYFCFKRAVHGPSVENVLQYCLRALLWDYFIALVMIIQRPFAGVVLRLTHHITFVTLFYSYYCYFVIFSVFVLLN